MTIGAATPLIFARSANSPPWPRGICTAGAGAAVCVRKICETLLLARDLVGIAIGDDGTGRAGEHDEDEQKADHCAFPDARRPVRCVSAIPRWAEVQPDSCAP